MSDHKKPVPAITPEMGPFFEAAKQHRLVVQCCRSCGHYRFPAREICSHCLSHDSVWKAVSGRGEVFSFNVMHQVYHPGFADEVPYAVVSVQLAEGPKMNSNLLGVAPEGIRIGMSVRVVFENVSEDVTLPKFEPA